MSPRPLWTTEALHHGETVDRARVIIPKLTMNGEGCSAG